MTDSGREGSRPPNDGRPSHDEYVLGADGRPIVDRYGRPVRRRPPAKRASQGTPGARTNPKHPPRRRPRRDPDSGRAAGRAGAAGAAGAAGGASAARPGPAQPDQTRFDVRGAGQPAQQQPPRQQRPTQYPPQSPSSQQRPPHPQPRPRSSEPPQAPPRASRPVRQRAPRRRRRRGPGCLGCFGVVVALIAVLTVVVTLWADARLVRVQSTPEQQVANTPGTNWLLVGSDSRQGLTEDEAAELGTGGDMGAGRTDTIMLLHIPRLGGGDTRLISIPRDSLVTVPGYGENKINAAFAYGGPQLLTETVEAETGLHIDHYAEIGMGGLARLVDAVGGVELCPEYPIDDPLANLDVQAGCQEMDGPTALGYVRTRATPMGDLDRVERQREFFAALMGEIASPGTLINPVRMFSLINSGAATFTVGENDHVWHLARVALAMGSGVSTETVPVSGFLDTSVGNVVMWDEAPAEAMWESMR